MFGGIVIQGQMIGRTLGYPTANLDISVKDTKFAPGIYAAHATLNHKTYNAALVLHSELDKVEVHLFDYNGPEFYGTMVSVEPIQKVSEIESYESEDALKEKIEADIMMVRRVLKI